MASTNHMDLHIAPLRRIETFTLHCGNGSPVVTSFGRMTERKAVFVRVQDETGLHGWGEVWCNYPPTAASYRATLIDKVLTPFLIGRHFVNPQEAHAELLGATSILAIQSGETGPFAQAIAGLDIALWDLVARRNKRPLWNVLGGHSPEIKVYASGINPAAPLATIERMQRLGHVAFKMKIGFNLDDDKRNLIEAREALGFEAALAADANQAWGFPAAIEAARLLDPLRLKWLEEPLRADRPWDEWRALADRTDTPLAAGENISNMSAFETAIASRALQIVQPDVAKWGGFSECLPLARRAIESGLRYYPHFLGGGIGLLASAHLLAAVGGDGLLEIDSNDNVLREAFCGSLASIRGGKAALTDSPGLGIEPDVETLRKVTAN